MAVSSEKIIGIDLGTTNSVVAVMEGGEVKVIANQEGNRLTPSVVAFTDKGEIARRRPGQAAGGHQPARTRSTRSSGSWAAGTARSSREEKIVPYKVVGGASDYVKVEVDGKQYTPPEISAMVLRKLKEAAENYLGHKVSKAVITVPAYFNDAQRQATKDAGQIAGLEVVAHHQRADRGRAGLRARQEEGREDRRVRPRRRHVRHVGPRSRATASFEVLATNGDTHLGGDDFDEVLINYIADEFKKEQRHRPAQGPDGPAAAAGSGREGQEGTLVAAARPTSTCRSSPPTPAGPKHLQMNDHAARSSSS